MNEAARRRGADPDATISVLSSTPPPSITRGSVHPQQHSSTSVGGDWNQFSPWPWVKSPIVVVHASEIRAIPSPPPSLESDVLEDPYPSQQPNFNESLEQVSCNFWQPWQTVGQRLNQLPSGSQQPAIDQWLQLPPFRTQTRTRQTSPVISWGRRQLSPHPRQPSVIVEEWLDELVPETQEPLSIVNERPQSPPAQAHSQSPSATVEQDPAQTSSSSQQQLPIVEQGLGELSPQSQSPILPNVSQNLVQLSPPLQALVKVEHLSSPASFPAENVLNHIPQEQASPQQTPAYNPFAAEAFANFCQAQPQLAYPGQQPVASTELDGTLLAEPSEAARAKMEDTTSPNAEGGGRVDQSTWKVAELALFQSAARQWWYWKDNGLLSKTASSGAALYRYFEFAFASAGMPRTYNQLKNRWSRKERVLFGRGEQREKRDGAPRALVTSARPVAKEKVGAGVRKRKRVEVIDEDDYDGEGDEEE